MNGGAKEPLASMALGVTIRCAPGVTRWARWSWTVTGVLPGAAPGHWTLLREEGDVAHYHAATLSLDLYRSDTEAYLTALAGRPPKIWVILRRTPDAPDDRPEPFLVTASAYEAQDYTDNGEDLVEPVPMPEGLEAWIAEFARQHHRDEPFVKRKRRPHHTAKSQDGIGDARIRQDVDVYRAPRSIREGGA